MPPVLFTRVLVANRGEIALRIVRALHELGIASVAVYAQDDAQAAHVRAADQACALSARGPAAYLDGAQLLQWAHATGCDAVHPGYGFLSERADFAQACTDAGLCFIGPTPEQLQLFGDKASARALALRCEVPVLAGSLAAVTLAQAQAFLAQQQGAGAMLKAIGGGGGRGMRAVPSAAELPAAYAACRAEALAAFGVDGVYIERLLRNARHIEVQLLGDGQQVMALGERECTVQRRFQKLVEIAPSPSLPEPLRQRLLEAALRMARSVHYQGLGTFEFLVDLESQSLPFVFIEANPRLQVEHTVTEAVTGLDLVQLQIALAAGRSLAQLGLDPAKPPAPQGFAIQWRINAESLDANGGARPSSGRITRFDLAGGPGIRIDSHGFAGAQPSPHYDSLLAKLIVHSRSAQFAAVLRRSQRALAECHIDGLATNLALLQALAARPEMAAQTLHTGWLEAHLPDLLEDANNIANKSYISSDNDVLDHNNGAQIADAVCAPMAARLLQFSVALGDSVPAGAELAVLEAMKMEHLLLAPTAGLVQSWCAAAGDYLAEGQPLLVLTPTPDAGAAVAVAAAPAPEHIRADLQRVIARHAFTLDANRPDAVAKRHAQGGRTARENIADLCDAGSFSEYGALAIAAQTRRRSLDDLIANTPADGLVSGIGSINADACGPERARSAVMAYDYSVLAGTQGMRNHHKKDRLLALVHQLQLPLVLFAEGGGGRPGDVDMPIVAGLNNHTFSQFAALSGQVPLIGIVHGRCFAGNAALLGCTDVIIATEASNIGMGGPAMIEGGGLGVFSPAQIGPSPVQAKNGVIDLLVPDEAAAVRAAKQYLGYFQGRLASWQVADQRLLRHAVPEQRLRAYAVRSVLHGLFDSATVLELRADFGCAVVTALARLEGRAVGVLANNPQHLGGAIDADAADKAARFMQLCDAHGLPIVSLVDTPGFMVGPEVEAQAQVRHVCRMFVVAARLSVPFFAVVLRKGYGLGAQAMTAGGFDAPVFTVAWPSGEFGAMGLEGAVRLGFRKELAAQAEGAARDALFQQLLAQQYHNGEAMNMAATLEIDAVIDPAETRNWLLRGLASTGPRTKPAAPRFIDPW